MPLFRFYNKKVVQLKNKSFPREKDLQGLFENNLEVMLGIRFIATEFSTGEKHSGRIDTLGVDENNSPVIIEYKWGESENIINQGLFYLDWLVDHKGDFQIPVEKKLNEEVEIDWNHPRLLLVAQSFTKYDTYAINRMAENIELWTYTLYDDGVISLSQLAASTSSKKTAKQVTKVKYGNYDSDYHLRKTNSILQAKFKELRDKVMSLENIQEITDQKSGITYRTTKSLARFEFNKNSIDILLREPKYDDPKKLVRDVTRFEWGYKGLVKMTKDVNVEDVFSLVKQSYFSTL